MKTIYSFTLLKEASTQLLVVCLFFLSLGANIEAGTIVWGGSVGDVNIDSQGNPLTSAMTFQLGVFADLDDGGTFDPAQNDISLWESHWVAFDQSAYAEIQQNGQSTDFGLYTGGATLLTDLTSNSDSIPLSSPAATFTPGAQAYIWGFNTKEIGADAEWLLVTNDDSDGLVDDDWVIPTPSSHSPETLQMRIPGATTSVFGSLGTFRSDDDDADLLIGEGVTLSTLDSFSIQTHTHLLPAVPEPSSFLLLLAGLGLFVGRRSRRG